MRYRCSSKKEQINFLKKFSFESRKTNSICRKTKASYLMTETLLVQKLSRSHGLFLEREWFLYHSSVLRNISYELEKNVRLFFAQKNQNEKQFDVFLGQNATYEVLVQFTKLWTLYIISVLRYRGSKKKNTRKFHENSSKIF